LVHEQTIGIHRFTKTHHSLDLGESHHLPPYSIIYDWPWGLHPNVIFLGTPKLGVPKFLKFELSPLWRPIIFCLDFQSKWSMKQSCNLCWEISNDMWHATWIHVIQSVSWILVVGGQIDNLTINISFSHNLCCKYSNGSCDPILDIYVLRTFE